MPTFVQFLLANSRHVNTRMVRKCRERLLQDELTQSVPHIIYVRLTSIPEENCQ